LENYLLQESLFFFQRKRQKVRRGNNNFMGQTSLPSLNKSGVFSYWNGLWDSQYQYAFLLTRFAYLELFFCKLFKDSILISNFFVLKTKDSTSLYFFKNFSYKLEMPVESKRFIRFIFCTSKLWVLKFGG